MKTEPNDFKGTPGPWQVVDTYDNYEPYTPETPQIIIWDGDEQARGPICDMGEIGDMNYAECLANANLIATGPELLLALQIMIAGYYDGLKQEDLMHCEYIATIAIHGKEKYDAGD